MKPETALTILCEGRYLRLVRRGEWEYAERVKASGAAVIVAVTEDGKLILTEQFRPPVNRRVIALPAGLAGDIDGQEAEDQADAARRELREETGYEAREMIRLTTGPSSAGLTSELVTFFRAKELEHVSSGGGVKTEDIQIHTIPLREIDGWLREQMSMGKLVEPKVYPGLYFINHEP